MKTLYNFFVLVRQIHERIYTHYQTLSSILNNEFILFCHVFILIIIKLLSDEVSSYTVVDFKREIIVESKICIMKIARKKEDKINACPLTVQCNGYLLRLKR